MLYKTTPGRFSFVSNRNLPYSSCLETSLLHHKFDMNFYEKVSYARIKELDMNAVEVFVNLYPKKEEFDHLKEQMVKMGISSYQEALKTLTYGPVEKFMLQLLSHSSNLLLKSKILIKIHSTEPKINYLLNVSSKATDILFLENL